MHLGQELSSWWSVVVIIFVQKNEWWYLLKHYNHFNFNNTIRSIQYLKSTMIISNIFRAIYQTPLQMKVTTGIYTKTSCENTSINMKLSRKIPEKRAPSFLFGMFFWTMWYQYLSIWSDHIEKQIGISICQQRVVLFLYSFPSIALTTDAGFHYILKIVWRWSPNFLNFGIIFQKETLLFTRQNEKEVVYQWIKLWGSSTINQQRVLQESSDLQDAKKLFANGISSNMKNFFTLRRFPKYANWRMKINTHCIKNI